MCYCYSFRVVLDWSTHHFRWQHQLPLESEGENLRPCLRRRSEWNFPQIDFVFEISPASSILMPSWHIVLQLNFNFNLVKVVPITLMAHGVPCPPMEIKKQWQWNVVFLNVNEYVKFLHVYAGERNLRPLYKSFLISKGVQRTPAQGKTFQIVCWLHHIFATL